VPPAELRATLAEANENILMLEKAIVTAKQAHDEAAPRYLAFFRACAEGEEPEARALLATGLEINCHNQEGVTSLHLAACNGHTAVVRLLLEQGASVDPRLGKTGAALGPSFAGATPWFLAKVNGRGAVAELLYSCGADPNATVDSGQGWQVASDSLAEAGGTSIKLYPE
jgi:ankyrin repeat protein